MHREWSVAGASVLSNVDSYKNDELDNSGTILLAEQHFRRYSAIVIY